jgi:hypothetical protein
MPPGAQADAGEPRPQYALGCASQMSKELGSQQLLADNALVNATWISQVRMRTPNRRLATVESQGRALGWPTRRLARATADELETVDGQPMDRPLRRDG